MNGENETKLSRRVNIVTRDVKKACILVIEVGFPLNRLEAVYDDGGKILSSMFFIYFKPSFM